MTTNDFGKLVELNDIGETIADKDEDVRGRVTGAAISVGCDRRSGA